MVFFTGMMHEDPFNSFSPKDANTWAPLLGVQLSIL